MKANHSLFYGKEKKSKRKSDTVLPQVSKRDLFDTLQFAKHLLKASAPRDYVYGILSLIDGFVEGKLDIQVNYQLSMVQVYTEAVRTLIRNYRSLRFLTASDLETSQKDLGLPSWVPDWSLGTHHIPLRTEEPLCLVNPMVNQQAMSLLPSLSPCGRILAITGLEVGKILHLYQDVVVDSKWEPKTPVKVVATMFYQLEDIAHRAFEVQIASGYEPKPL
jgi:hypothetical protein